MKYYYVTLTMTACTTKLQFTTVMTFTILKCTYQSVEKSINFGRLNNDEKFRSQNDSVISVIVGSVLSFSIPFELKHYIATGIVELDSIK